MNQLVSVARSIYGRALYTLLFPFVFLITLLVEGPQHWRDCLIGGFGFCLLMTLGFSTVYVIHGRV